MSAIETAKRETQQIFDLTLKRLLRSSSVAVVQFINGLFGTEHSLDSIVDYPNTENVSDKLKRLLSDMVVVINGLYAYHLEAEIKDNENIALRVFEYGFAEGLRTKKILNSGEKIWLRFPNTRIIYWETTARTPDEVTLSLEFPEGGNYDYVVKTFKFLDHDINELEEKKLALLLPFYVLKLRKRVKKSRHRAELCAEMKAILENIDAALERAVETGLMSKMDACNALEHTERLYKELYQEYVEFKEVDAMLRDKILTYSEEAELKGREEGRKEGREENSFKVAKKLLARGMPLSEVADIAELPIDKIQTLSLH